MIYGGFYHRKDRIYMAFIHLNFRSKTLMQNTDLNIILPDAQNPPFKTLYLLHGLHGDYSVWVRNTSLEQYVKNYNLAVVMPGVGNSFYTDMKFGSPYYTYVSDELIRYTRKIFPLSDKREDTFVAGASMGGYGAVKLALKNPDTFCAAASLSGCLDVESIAHSNDSLTKSLLYLIMGNTSDMSESEENVIYLAKQLISSDAPNLPRIYQVVGTEDFLYENNQIFKRAVEPIWKNYKYDETPGAHTWDFWDKYIPKMLDFFFEP